MFKPYCRFLCSLCNAVHCCWSWHSSASIQWTNPKNHGSSLSRDTSSSNRSDRCFANHESVSFWHCDESSEGSGGEARFASGRFWRRPPEAVPKSSMRVRAATPRRARRGPNTCVYLNPSTPPRHSWLPLPLTSSFYHGPLAATRGDYSPDIALHHARPVVPCLSPGVSLL